MNKLNKTLIPFILMIVVFSLYARLIDKADLAQSTRKLLDFIGIVSFLSIGSITLYQLAKTKTNLILMGINLIITPIVFLLLFFMKIESNELLFVCIVAFVIFYGVQIFYSMFIHYKNYKNNKTQD